MKKTKHVLEGYELGAIPVSYTAEGVEYPVWLVVSRNKKHGGLCYLLVKSELTSAIDVAKWAFRGYGLRWKIEEYHYAEYIDMQSGTAKTHITWEVPPLTLQFHFA